MAKTVPKMPMLVVSVIFATLHAINGHFVHQHSMSEMTQSIIT